MATKKTTRKPTKKAAKKTTGVHSRRKPTARRGGTSVATPTAFGQVSGTPVFADPVPTLDPTRYTVPHASDAAAYAEMDALIKASQFPPIAFPVVANTQEPVLTLATALGPTGATTEKTIQQAGQIVFHCVGDTGATKGPKTENEVVSKMLADFQGEASSALPQFFYILGDVVYSFGEHKYYFDQFYDAYRDYPGPIFAIPGNHDGIVLPPPGPGTPTLSAFLANFCNSDFKHAADSMGISRTTMIQPGAYFTFEAPFVRVVGLYSNVLENPGVISTQGGRFPLVTDTQLTFLEAALQRVKQEGFKGALLLSVHHPPYASGLHSASLAMLKDMDAVCNKVGVWPHAVLSGHEHNYQRYTRGINGRQIPYLVAGNGGHNVNSITRGTTIRTPVEMKAFEQPEENDTVTFESYDDKNYGYLRILVTPSQLRIEYHPASDGSTTKTPDDAVTVDLASGTIVPYVPTA